MTVKKVPKLLKLALTVSACAAADRFVGEFAASQPSGEAYGVGILFGMGVSVFSYAMSRSQF
jgi:hypothetical protein